MMNIGLLALTTVFTVIWDAMTLMLMTKISLCQQVNLDLQKKRSTSHLRFLISPKTMCLSFLKKCSRTNRLTREGSLFVLHFLPAMTIFRAIIDSLFLTIQYKYQLFTYSRINTRVLHGHSRVCLYRLHYFLQELLMGYQ